ncbi:MAG: class II glutamine amidotransferase [Piscinibacter sp.]|nr:class II glutamine amidotransferase [Piscinibacter sp.]
MCQLFALNSREPAAVTFAFTGFSARGGATDAHSDGFGLAFHEGNACRRFVDHGRASDSVLAEFLRTHPIRARTAVAHIRKATQGAVNPANCHPFVREWQGREWSFCHNGDLKDFHPRLDGSHLPVGQTDSERAFCWMLQRLRRQFRRGLPDWPQLAPAIAELAERIGAHGKFNFLLSDGHALYAHGHTRLCWLQRRPPFGTAHLVDHDLELDLATANGPDDCMVLVATEPLTRNEAWQFFAPGELRVFAEGEEVWRQVPSPAAAGAALPALALRPA